MKKLIISSALIVSSLFMFSCSKDYAANAAGVYTIAKVTANGIDVTETVKKQITKLDVKKTADLKVTISFVNPAGGISTDAGDALNLAIDNDNRLSGIVDGGTVSGSVDGVKLSLILTNPSGTQKTEITANK